MDSVTGNWGIEELAPVRMCVFTCFAKIVLKHRIYWSSVPRGFDSVQLLYGH